MRATPSPLRRASGPTAAALLTTLLAIPAEAATVATWNNAVSGSWLQGSNWSSSPFFPKNGNPSGTTYEVVIDAVGDAYTVGVDGNPQGPIVIDSLLIDSADATVDHFRDNLVVNTLHVENGTYQFTAGKLVGATITTGLGGVLRIGAFSGSPAAILDGVTLKSQMAPGLITVQNGLTLTDGGEVQLGKLIFSGSQTIGGEGVVTTGNYSQTRELYPSSGTLIIGSGITIRAAANMLVSSSLGGVNNEGTLTTDGVARLTVEARGQAFVNSGTIDAQSGGTIGIEGGNWRNLGTIRASAGGTIDIYNNKVDDIAIDTPDLGTIESAGGQVILTGANVNNAGHTLTLDAGRGSWLLHSSTITGGVLDNSDGTTFISRSGFSKLSGVELAGTLRITSGASGSGLVEWRDDSTLTGVIQIAPTGANDEPELRVHSGNTLAGTGEVVFDGQGSRGRAYSLDGTLKIGSGITIRSGIQGGVVGDVGRPLENAGLISAQTSGKVVSVRGSDWINTGTLSASNGGRLQLEGTFKDINLGAFDATGGTLALVGTMTIASPVFTLNGTGQTLHLWDGKIQGGTIATANGAQLIAPSTKSGTFDGVKIDTDIQIENNSRIFITGSTELLAGRTISVTSTSANSSVQVTGGLLTGQGQVVFEGSSSNGRVYRGSGGGTLTLGPGITVRTGDIGGHVGADGQTLVNQGVLWAAHPTSALQLDGNWSNAGLLKVDGQLDLAGAFSTSGIGSVLRQGSGRIVVLGSLTNTAQTLTVDRYWSFGNGIGTGPTVLGGTIQAAASEWFSTNAGNTTLNGVTLAAELRAQNGSVVRVTNGLTLDHSTISLVSGDPLTNPASMTGLDFVGSGTLGGTGEVRFDGVGTNDTLRSFAVDMTIGSGVAVRTGTQGGTVSAAFGGSIRNEGIISAETTGKTLTISGSNFTNPGRLEAHDSTLRATVPFWSNEGTIHLENGTAVITGFSFINAPTGVIEGTGTLDVSGTTFTNYGYVEPGLSPGLLSITGNYTQAASGVLVIEIGGATPGSGYDQLAVSGTANLGGTLEIHLINGFVPGPDDEFTFLTAASFNGTFANLESTFETPQGTFDVTFDGTTFRLSNFVAVPEPASVALVAIGASVLLRRRAR